MDMVWSLGFRGLGFRAHQAPEPQPKPRFEILFVRTPPDVLKEQIVPALGGASPSRDLTKGVQDLRIGLLEP